jgi:hypothetical protein
MSTGLLSGKRDSNSRRQPWQGCTLPLSYSRKGEGLNNGFRFFCQGGKSTFVEPPHGDRISPMATIGTDTQKDTFPCRCVSEHRFSATLLICVNTRTHPDTCALLDEDGAQEVLCPVCARRMRLSEPIWCYDPHGERFALLIPLTLSHRICTIQSAVLARLAEPPALLPPTAVDFVTRVGRNALMDWWPEAADVSAAGPTSIHTAFADLNSLVPPPPEEETE